MEMTGVSRALAYPYAIPQHSYCVENGAVMPLPDATNMNFRDGRIPVLAAGSNQSPVQLLRKFSAPGWGAIHCELAEIEDFDIVYAAHIAAYGAIPAALFPSPGTTAKVFINWLSPRQLDHMHSTEINSGHYDFAELIDVVVRPDTGALQSSLGFYRTRFGAFAPDGEAIALAEVAAKDRRYPSLSQSKIQAKLLMTFGLDTRIEEFVEVSIQDEDERQRRKQTMATTALPFEHPNMTIKIRPD